MGGFDLCMGHEGLHNEGVDRSNAAIHIDDLAHACLDEALYTRRVQIQADLQAETAIKPVRPRGLAGNCTYLGCQIASRLLLYIPKRRDMAEGVLGLIMLIPKSK